MDNDHPYLNDVKKAYGIGTGNTIFGLVPLGLLLLAIQGIYSAMRDSEGTSLLGAMPVAAPAIMAGWWAIQGATARKLSTTSLMVRLATSSLLVWVPLTAAIALATLLMWMMPSNQAAIMQSTADNYDFHYYWGESIGGHLLLTSLAGGAIAAAAGFFGSLLIMLPAYAIRKPSTVTAGSHLEGTPERGQRGDAVLLTVGLALFTIGLFLQKLFAMNTDVQEAQTWVMNSITGGFQFSFANRWDREALFWILGTAALATGAVMLAIVIARAIWARRKSA